MPSIILVAIAELATLALACDRTRVVSYMFSLPAAHVYYRHLDTDMNADFHDTICHTDAGDKSNQPRGRRRTMRCLAELLTNMKATQHGDGRVAGDAHVNFQGEHLSRALLTVAQLIGSTATSFGLDKGKATSALPGIQV